MSPFVGGSRLWAIYSETCCGWLRNPESENHGVEAIHVLKPPGSNCEIGSLSLQQGKTHIGKLKVTLVGMYIRWGLVLPIPVLGKELCRLEFHPVVALARARQRAKTASNVVWGSLLS